MSLAMLFYLLDNVPCVVFQCTLLTNSIMLYLPYTHRREPGLKNRDGGLGRIHRSIPVTEEDAASAGQHPFRYDVDFVLGGRITNVDRTELLYTTADAEGMTERRKRNPTVAVKEAQETEGLKPPKAKKKSKPGTKKVTAKKGKASAGAKHKGKKAVRD